MVDKKRCVRCERLIDGIAKLCPFCNWDQDAAAPAVTQQAAPPADYVPPQEHRKRRLALYAIGGVVLLITAFTLGSLIHGANPEETAAKTGGSLNSTTAGPAPGRVDLGKSAKVDLVPVGGNAPIVEQPITSAPMANPTQGMPNEYQRSDATAVSSAEYQQLAERAKAEKQTALIDPRLLTAPIYRPRPRPAPVAPPAETPEQAAGSENSIRTRAHADYIPFPDIHVDRPTTIQLNLLVGADGRVHSVDIDGTLPGQTAKLIAAIHSWRFRPATENGVPVASQFSTAVSFHANE